MAIKCGNMIIGGVRQEVVIPSVETAPVKKVQSISAVLKNNQEQEDTETHIKIKDGELERLIPKKSSYMVDLGLGSK